MPGAGARRGGHNTGDLGFIFKLIVDTHDLRVCGVNFSQAVTKIFLWDDCLENKKRLWMKRTGVVLVTNVRRFSLLTCVPSFERIF